ncbi:MAG: hypothetical protein KME44_08270, partial [Candidatus Thiodiazotropha sp. (ex Lucina pensylvanica)]|nr:hypothetical protein [Candidatus Thiodiazotropha sp. (ex Lucina pensylvanica)]
IFTPFPCWFGCFPAGVTGQDARRVKKGPEKNPLIKIFSKQWYMQSVRGKLSGTSWVATKNHLHGTDASSTLTYTGYPAILTLELIKQNNRSSDAILIFAEWNSTRQHREIKIHCCLMV